MSGSHEWDDTALLNPHDDYLQLGRDEGEAAGLKSGFEDGRSLGRTKAVELGLELGFMLGCCSAVSGMLGDGDVAMASTLTSAAAGAEATDGLATRDSDKVKKVRSNLDYITKQIHDFPSPEELFLRNVSPRDDESKSGASSEESTGYTKQQNHYEDSSQVDVVQKLQRIRARFKLLTIQMNINKHSLKNVMNMRMSSDHSARSQSDEKGESSTKTGTVCNDHDPSKEGIHHDW